MACQAIANQSDSSELHQSFRDKLLEAGDDGVSKREITHFAYPNGETGINNEESVAEWLASSGFRVEGAITFGGKSAAMRDGFAFHRKESPFSKDFDANINYLKENLAVFGWSYDGWVTTLVRKD